LPNPLIPTTGEEFSDYHDFMGKAEATYTEMTRMTNRLYALQGSLKEVIAHLEEKGNESLKGEADALLEKLDQWDKAMVQRLSKAYDDVENYVNGFTAEYLTALNHGDSGIPRINQGTRDKIQELNVRWNSLKARAGAIISEDVKNLNEKLYAQGIGALYLGD
jgi:hypothetical protein